MCVFCAAVPAVGAMGAAATAKRKAAKRQQTQHDTSAATETSTNYPQWALHVPTEKLTLVVIGGLLVSSAVYHNNFGA